MLYWFIYYLWATTRQNVSSGVSDQARHKPACTATEAIYSLEISAIKFRDIILSRQWTTKVLIRQHGCAGRSAPLLFAYDIRHFFLWPSSYLFIIFCLLYIIRKGFYRWIFCYKSYQVTCLELLDTAPIKPGTYRTTYWESLMAVNCKNDSSCRWQPKC